MSSVLAPLALVPPLVHEALNVTFAVRSAGSSTEPGWQVYIRSSSWWKNEWKTVLAVTVQPSGPGHTCVSDQRCSRASQRMLRHPLPRSLIEMLVAAG